VEFVAGDFGHGAGETDLAGGFLDLAAQVASQGGEPNRFLIFHLTFPGPSGRPELAYPHGPLPFGAAKAEPNGCC